MGPDFTYYLYRSKEPAWTSLLKRKVVCKCWKAATKTWTGGLYKCWKYLQTIQATELSRPPEIHKRSTELTTIYLPLCMIRHIGKQQPRTANNFNKNSDFVADSPLGPFIALDQNSATLWGRCMSRRTFYRETGAITRCLRL